MYVTPLSSLLSDSLVATSAANKGVMQKLKRHGNGGSCLKKHEKLKIKIFAERVMESHIYSSIDFYISISKKLFSVIRLKRVNFQHLVDAF
jgi:hypothetical protein